MKTTRALALLVAALGLAGCDLFYAETEIAEACVTPPQETFTGGLATASFEFDYDLGERIDLLTKKGVTYELRLSSLDVVLGSSGAVDLTTVQRIRILAVAPGLPPLGFVDYAPAPGSATPTRLALSQAPGADLGAYLLAGSLRLRVEVQAPTSSSTEQLTADFGACFFVKARYDYL